MYLQYATSDLGKGDDIFQQQLVKCDIHVYSCFGVLGECRNNSPPLSRVTVEGDYAERILGRQKRRTTSNLYVDYVGVPTTNLQP